MSKLQVSRAKDRHFFIRTYLTEMQIKVILLSHNIQHYAYILHDCDTHKTGDKAGELKEPHYHIILSLYSQNSVQAVNRWFSGFTDNKGMLIQSHVEIAVDRFHCFDYLTHSTKACIEAGDYIYSKSLIVCDDLGFYNGSRTADFDTATLIMIDLMQGVPYEQMMFRYGKNFILNSQKYIDMAYLILKQGSFKPENYGITNEDIYRCKPREMPLYEDI